MRSGGGLRSRGWSGRVGDGFEVIDLGGGDIDEAGLISVEVETGDGADDLAALVKDGESVAEDGGVGGEAGESDEKCGAEGELEQVFHVRVRLRTSGAKARYFLVP